MQYIQDKFILDNHTVVPVDTSTTEGFIEWAKWFEEADRSVKKTDVTDSIHVSTVFLGLDHNHFGGEPLLFETMVFRNGSGCEMDRCCTWDEAEIMHDEMVKRVEAESGS
ncbi:hypothetical protein [Endozoicomonas lisbonensis]|uniref:Uncharacterized protein n=1 Tax=Endozoicomonas lisbonensis TaxID=3120522 RepID=A0ABV2SCU3_9GAMM